MILIQRVLYQYNLGVSKTILSFQLLGNMNWKVTKDGWLWRMSKKTMMDGMNVLVITPLDETKAKYSWKSSVSYYYMRYDTYLCLRPANYNWKSSVSYYYIRYDTYLCLRPANYNWESSVSYYYMRYDTYLCFRPANYNWTTVPLIVDLINTIVYICSFYMNNSSSDSWSH